MSAAICSSLAALHRIAGEEEAYVQHGGDALYDVQRRVLGALLACTRGPSTLAGGSDLCSLDDRLAEITVEYVPDNPEGKRAAVRHGLARRLLDDPVVYFDDLSEEQRDYLVYCPTNRWCYSLESVMLLHAQNEPSCEPVGW